MEHSFFLLTFALSADAQPYPSRPVRVIVPYSPGGSSDVTARILGEKLREILGQQFVIDNRPGAAGSMGREIVAKATPDGYTLLLGDSPHTINVHILKHVPYKSIALASADVIAGQIQSAFPTVPGIVSHARAGRLRVLAITTLKRSSALPDVPTFEESGVAGMTVSNWFGMFAPAGLPGEILAKLHKAILGAMQAPDVRTKFDNLSLDITTMTPREFDAHLRSELEKWGKVVKAAGIKAE